MKEESALVDALLQKLESAKATYVTNLNEAHDAVVASLKTTQNDEDVVQESSQDSLGRTNAKTKREDILQTERDPLDCETFYADHDLKEFLGDLDAQLLYERLEPDSTGGGFIYVCNGRIMDGPPLKENILKLLQPLPSLEFDADDGKLHNTRANDPGWVYNDHQASFNAIWFTFLDGDYSGSWNLYHDAVSEEHPQNFWEMIRAGNLVWLLQNKLKLPVQGLCRSNVSFISSMPDSRDLLGLRCLSMAGALNPDTVLPLLVCLRSHVDMGGICSALFTTASQARIRYDHDEQDRHFVRSYFAITYFSTEERDMIFPWHENGLFYEGLDSTTVTRCHGVVALTNWENLSGNTCWTILVVNTTAHVHETPGRRPKSSNGILEYFRRIDNEINHAFFRMSRFSDKVWRTVKMPRDFLFSKDTRERFFADDAQLTLARRYFWALQTLSTINESLKSIMETWERHQSAFDTNDRLPYFHRKLTSVEKLEVKRSTQEIVGTIKSMAERIVKNEERRSEIMTLRDGLLSTSQLVENRIARTETENMRRITMASIYSLPLLLAPSILGVADLPKFFQKLAMNRLAIAMPVVCVSAYLTVAALEPHGESFIGRGARRLRELTIGLKEDHDGHDTPVVVVGEAATGEGYP